MNLKGILITALAVALWSGCSQQSPTGVSDNSTDQSAGVLTQEISDMGSAVEFSQFGGMAKQLETTAANPDTITIDGLIVRRPWAYDNGWWVREIEITANQRSYSKIDSVRFADANDGPVQVPGWITVAGWTHYRHVELANSANTFQLDFAMQVKLDVGLQKIGTWNGTVTGTLNGTELTSTVVTDVVRTRAIGYWRFPESGTIHIERPAQIADITFTGNGGATAVVNRQGRTTTITVDIRTGTQTVSD